MLKYDKRGANKLKDRATAFFEDESLFSVEAVLRTATEEMLTAAKLKVLWAHVQDLQERTGFSTEEREAKPKAKRQPAALTEEQVTKRKADCVAEWTKHANAKDTLEIADDGTQFACTVCSGADELVWHQLRGASDIRRHCIGGATSVQNGKTPLMSHHARNVARLDQEEEEESKEKAPAKKNKAAKKKVVVSEEEEEKKMPRLTSSKKSQKRDKEVPSPEIKSKKKTKKSHGATLPTTLPKLTGRIDSDPVQFKCQWGKKREELCSIVELVEHYGERIVQRVNEFDARLGVEFVAERIVDKNSGRYLVHWEGYPEVFETWELGTDARWEAGDEDGEHKRELIAEWEKI